MVYSTPDLHPQYFISSKWCKAKPKSFQKKGLSKIMQQSSAHWGKMEMNWD